MLNGSQNGLQSGDNAGQDDIPVGPRPYGQWPVDIWLAALLVLAASRTAHIAPELPNRLPMHFGFNGQVDGWATRGFWSLYGILLIAAALWLGMSISIWFIARVRDPKSIINMPNKDRLSQRAAENVRTITIRSMGVLEVVMVVMLVHMQWLSLDVALGKRQGLPRGLMIFYIILISVVSLYMVARIIGAATNRTEGGRNGRKSRFI